MDLLQLQSDETKDKCCCSLPTVIRGNDAKFVACDRNLRDLQKCYSCISPICQRPIKIYANSRNYVACEQMLPLPRDCIHSMPNLSIREGRTRSKSRQAGRETPIINDDQLVNCLAPKCRPTNEDEKAKEEKENATCQNAEPELTEKEIKAIKRAVLKETNRYRRMHCACPLIMDDKISSYAQEWAEHLASKNMLETRPIPKYGENIMCARKPLFCVERMMKLWYQEKYNYDFIRPCFDIYAGHFTQMVWWETQLLGIGMASNDYRMWIVCNYHPAGNIRGHFKENVLPRKLLLSDSDIEMDKMKKSKEISIQAKCPMEQRQSCKKTKTYMTAKECQTQNSKAVTFLK
ncbi:uncharacterized protein [Drosophila tropicalis]|uniref:uncharacterized protein n=1 Tax=Drosophila tropicalis TaxID=46794 RepID=UPI0035ABCFF5